jgi:adenylate cyclase
MSPRQITNELGIRYLIEGRVQTSGMQTRIGVALIDGVKEKALWDENKTYQGSDLFDIQDDFSDFVTREIDGNLLQLEVDRVRNMPSKNMSAWEHYVRGFTTFGPTGNPTQEKLTAAISELRIAFELEPDHVHALASLANHININTILGGSPDSVASRQEACRLADKAIALTQNNSIVMAQSFLTLAQFCGEAIKSVQLGKRTVERFKHSGVSHTFLGAAMFWAGKLDEAILVLENAEQNFPNDPATIQWAPLYKAFIYTEKQEWETAYKLSRTALNLDPANVFYMIQLVNELGVLNHPEEAKEIWSQILERFPNFTIENFEWWWKQGLITDERVEPHVRGLKRVGVEEQQQ